MFVNDYKTVFSNKILVDSMPATFQLNCPHCGTSSVAFELIDESWLPRDRRWHVCVRCNHCAGLVVLALRSVADETDSPSTKFITNPDWFEIENMYPAGGSEVPAHLPEEIEGLFKQGADNVPANPDAAGIMFRKTLEAVLRDKCPGGTGTLSERIKEAAEIGVLTADLASYAHTIRLEGNEATHGTYEEADADQLHSFTTLVLQYVYTLPGMQAEINAEAHAAAQNDNAPSGET